jgi:hypothetical protein
MDLGFLFLTGEQGCNGLKKMAGFVFRIWGLSTFLPSNRDTHFTGTAINCY